MTRIVAAIMFLCQVVVAAPAILAQERARRVGDAPGQSAAAPEAVPKQRRLEGSDDDVVRIRTTLVMVPVSITDRNGRYIPDLQKEDFRIYEEGIEQEVAYFGAVEKPFTVVLMLDTSASTWSKLGRIRDAAAAFVEQLRPDDRVMVVSFARGFTVKCEATSDRKTIREAIRSTGRGLSTHLYDAVDKIMRNHLDHIRGRKAVVLFTDGVDASSNDATYEGTVRFAEELDALIYPIRYDTYDPASDTGSSPVPQSSSRLPSILRKIPLPIFLPTNGGGGGGGTSVGSGSSRADYARGERYLHELAELTGGRAYEANRDLSYLRAAFSQIAAELRRQYSLGYYPKQQGQAGERRHIRVRVRPPDLAVRTRVSYIYKPAPGANTTP